MNYFETYEEAFENLSTEHQRSYRELEKNPEQHPLYSDEWKVFWCRRYKELMAEGKDANNYDYKPEWIMYWICRMKELHRLELAKKTELLRKKFALRTSAAVRIEDNILSSTACTAKRVLSEHNLSEDCSRSSKEPKCNHATILQSEKKMK